MGTTRVQTQSLMPKAQSLPPIGMIGLGIMGSAMAGNLMRAGYPVVGFDVLARRCRDHARAGGRSARSALEVGTAADVVICSLPSGQALLDVADGLGDQRRVRRIVIETSTLPIAVKEQARRRLARAGTILLDCPLSGTGAQARARDVVVYASGLRTAYRTVTPVMGAFARAHYYIGPFGAGSKMKYVANLLVAIHNVAAAEAMVLAMKAGLDPAMTLKVIADGAGSSRMLQVRGPMMVRGDYSDAMVTLSIWAKDMTIIGDFARQVGCPTPLFAATAAIYTAAMAMGREAEDTAAVCAVLEQMANHRRTPARRRRRS
jgi:3-hydroxyisobutyrate dehydrogenase-like beta-hydroxyacid dehydrogenase